MRGVAIIGACALVLVVAAPANATRSAQKKPAKCTPGHSHVLVADTQGQVYEAPTVASLPETRSFFGCAYGRSKSYRLGIPPLFGSSQGSGGTRLYTLAGPIVAFEEFATSNLPAGISRDDQVVVRDLRSGRFLHDLPTGTPAAPPENGDVGVGEIQSLVVKSDGAVAWIVQALETVGGQLISNYQVHTVDASGSRVVVSGREIDPSSLALAGSTLYWTQGGKPFSATLN